MRTVKAEALTNAVEKMIKHSLVHVEDEAVQLMRNLECGGLEYWALNQIILNADEAAKTNSFACQDTGLAVIFVDLGREVYIDGNFCDAINNGVRLGYADARKSVANPLNRINTIDNTPAVIYTDIVEGDKVKISFLAKGAGSENMSKIYMLTPSKGRKGIIDCVVDCVTAAGANPCPPIVIGVGVGGTFDKAAVLSKRALLRPTGKPSADAETANLEAEILKAVNDTKIGVAGLQGDVTALGVSVMTHPTHIGMLPVAVNIQCHSVRHDTVIL